MSDLPQVVHSGTVNIGSFELTVHVLDNGKRVIDEEYLCGFFEFIENGGPLTEKDGLALAKLIHGVH
ncbi:MAG: hypothetical protein V3U60_16660 [Gammaproteobacteria bacterium]